MKSKKKIKNIAAGGILTALGVVIMALGSIFEVLDISAAAVASLIILLARIETGRVYPWLIYAATALLSALLLPNKYPAILYIVFIGFYPILKSVYESFPRITSYIAKYVTFNLCMAVFAVLTFLLFTKSSELVLPLYLLIPLGVLVVNFTFFLYDTLLTKLVILYVRRFRRQFGIGRFFD